MNCIAPFITNCRVQSRNLAQNCYKFIIFSFCYKVIIYSRQQHKRCYLKINSLLRTSGLLILTQIFYFLLSVKSIKNAFHLEIFIDTRTEKIFLIKILSLIKFNYSVNLSIGYPAPFSQELIGLLLLLCIFLK